MDQYFERIQQLLSRSDFPARIRFMIEDVIDLRNAKVDFQGHQLNFDCKSNFVFYFFITHHTIIIMYDTPRNLKEKYFYIYFYPFEVCNIKLNHNV